MFEELKNLKDLVKYLDELKEINTNIKNLTEAIRDLNVMAGSFLGYKVNYEKDDDRSSN